MHADANTTYRKLPWPQVMYDFLFKFIYSDLYGQIKGILSTLYCVILQRTLRLFFMEVKER